MSRGIQKPFGNMATPATFEAGSEFTDREPQWPATRVTQDLVTPGALLRNLDTTPLGEPAVDVDVRSVYDVRPILAFDVNLPLTSTDLLFKSAEGSLLTTQVVTPVPLGYVFVLRKLAPFFFGALPPVVFRNDALLTLKRNAGDVPYNILIPVGVEMTNLDTFIIYDEGEQFGAKIDLTAITALFTGTFFGCTFYGNFLRKTGRVAEQEIGNPVRGSRG